jgi:hypothetical protein
MILRTQRGWGGEGLRDRPVTEREVLLKENPKAKSEIQGVKNKATNLIPPPCISLLAFLSLWFVTVFPVLAFAVHFVFALVSHFCICLCCPLFLFSYLSPSLFTKHDTTR